MRFVSRKSHPILEIGASRFEAHRSMRVSGRAHKVDKAMTTIDNRSGVPHFWFEQTGPEGERLDVLVVRATFDFASNGALMTLAVEQQPIAFGDMFSGPVATDPMRAVLRDDGDLLPYKPGTDMLVSGHALAPDGKPHASWLAGISVGAVNKILRLHGPRQFRKRLFGWRLGPSELVDRIPLDYRLAYGGCVDVPSTRTADANPDFVKHLGNPAGCGWLPRTAAYKHLPKSARKYIKEWLKAQTVLAAPQFESVATPVRHPYQNISAEGLGPIARWWQPRLGRQGSYDDQWRAGRYPLLPENFDPRFYQSAPSDLVCTPHLIGDERLVLVGLLGEKREMRLPGWRLVAVVTRASGKSEVSFLILDTLRLDLDSGKATLVWRAHFDYEDPVLGIALAATTAVIESESAPTALASTVEAEL